MILTNPSLPLIEIFLYIVSVSQRYSLVKKNSAVLDSVESVMFSVIDTAEFSMTMTLQGTNPFFQDLWELLKG